MHFHQPLYVIPLQNLYWQLLHLLYVLVFWYYDDLNLLILHNFH